MVADVENLAKPGPDRVRGYIKFSSALAKPEHCDARTHERPGFTRSLFFFGGNHHEGGNCPTASAEKVVLRDMPASYFVIVLGLAGLGNAWRGAERTWQPPRFIEDYIYLITGIVWAVLVVLYVLKALLVPDKLPMAAAHSVHCCFIGLAGAGTMLVAGSLAPDARTSVCVLFEIGFAFTLCFAVGVRAAYRG